MQASTFALPGGGWWLRPGVRSWATASLAVSRSTNSDGRSTSLGRLRAEPATAEAPRLSLEVEACAGSGKLNVDLRSPGRPGLADTGLGDDSTLTGRAWPSGEPEHGRGRAAGSAADTPQ